MARLAPFYPAMLVFVGAVCVALGGFWASWRQSNFNQEIRNKNDEIANLQRESADAVTGGNSFASIAFQVFDREGKMVNAFAMPDELLLVPMVVHHGKHPLYDVSARIVDLDAAQKDLSKALQNYPIGNMTPNLAVSTNFRIPHDGKDFKFNIFFVGRNGTWIQFLRMTWVGDGWARASKIVRNGKVVLREVSDNFPRNEKLEIDWGEPGAQDESSN